MMTRPFNRNKYPNTVRGTGFGWGVLDTSMDTPHIVAEFDTEVEAWDHAHALNAHYWLLFDSNHLTRMAILKASEESRLPRMTIIFSSLFKRFKQALNRRALISND